MGKASLKEACLRFNRTAASAILGRRKAYESEGESDLMSKAKGRPMMKQPIKRKVRTSKRPLKEETNYSRKMQHRQKNFRPLLISRL